MQFHKLQLGRYSSAITHYIGVQTTNVRLTREKKNERELSFVQDLKRLGLGCAKTDWNSGNGTKKQICRWRFVRPDCKKGLITSSGKSSLSPAQKWGQLRWVMGDGAAQLPSEAPGGTPSPILGLNRLFLDIEPGVICYQGDIWFCVWILSGELKMTKQTP